MTARLLRLLAFECFLLGPIDAIESNQKKSRRDAGRPWRPVKRRQVSALILGLSSASRQLELGANCLGHLRWHHLADVAAELSDLADPR